MEDFDKNIMDAASFFVLVGAWAEILTPIATLVTIIWGSIRIYEYIKSKVKGDRTWTS